MPETSGSMPGASPLRDLDPFQMAGIFGRSSSQAMRIARMSSLSANSRLWLNVGLCITVLFVALIASNTLLNTTANMSVLKVIFSGSDVAKQSTVELPFFQDVVALVAVFTALITPFLAYNQAVGISEFVKTNSENVKYRSSTLNRDEINMATDRANVQFAKIGRPLISLVTLGLAAATGLGLTWELQREGVFATWNPTNLSDANWRLKVYANWWANEHHHLANSLLLDVVAIYFFYFLFKQLLMGLVFAIFLVSAAEHGLNVFPSLAVNKDGYWGLRSARRFLQWTYSSALTHLVQSLFVLAIWVPFGSLTIFVAIFVFIVNAAFVVYPTIVAVRGITAEKCRYVSSICPGEGALEAQDADRIQDIWSRPTLPFRLRSSVSAVTVYLLLPILLAVAFRLFGVQG